MPLDTKTKIEEPVSGLWKNAENPDVYVDIFGTTHAVWAAETLSTVKRIFYIFDDGKLNFNPSDITLVGNVNRNSNFPKIAVNRSGRVSIVFEVERLGGSDIHMATNDGSGSLSTSIDISRNTGVGIENRKPRIVINDKTKDQHFIWRGTHISTGKQIIHYTRILSTVLIPTISTVSPDINHDCGEFDVALMGDLDQVFVTFEQLDPSPNKTNIRLAQGNETGFSLLGMFQDSLSLTILNRPSAGTNNIYPRLAVKPRINEILSAVTADDDPTLVVTWEDDGSPNKIKFAQRFATDFSDGTVATSGVHRPVVNISQQGLVIVSYYKTAGSNNIVNLSFKDLDSNVWTEANDIANGHAFGDGLYNIEMLCASCTNIYITFKTGPVTGPQRIIHPNNFRTGSLFSFEIIAEILDTPSDTRSRVAMHIDDKIGNSILETDAPARAAIIYTDFTVDFSEPDGIGDVHLFGGVIAPKPTMIAVTDNDGDNKPEFTWFLPGEHSEGFFDLYYKLCGASGIVPYQENIMLSGTFVSGIDGIPEPGYIFSHEGPSGISLTDIYGFGVRKCEGPWSEEFCFRLGDISVSHPTISPPNNKISIEKCDLMTLGGSAEPGSIIESQTLIEYSDADGTIEINRTIITGYQIDLQGNYSGSLALSLLPNTTSIRTEVIARDSDGNLSDPIDSVSNLVSVENVPPAFESFKAAAQATCSALATNSTTVNVVTLASGDVFEIKLWEAISAGGTGEIGAVWVPYSPTLPFTFANNTNEVKTIFGKMRDSCGNESSILSTNIELDTIPPRITSATFDPATRRLTLSFSEPVTAIDLSKIRVVKA